jgi:hypothetical protein
MPYPKLAKTQPVPKGSSFLSLVTAASTAQEVLSLPLINRVLHGTASSYYVPYCHEISTLTNAVTSQSSLASRGSVGEKCLSMLENCRTHIYINHSFIFEAIVGIDSPARRFPVYLYNQNYPRPPGHQREASKKHARNDPFCTQ